MKELSAKGGEESCPTKGSPPPPTTKCSSKQRDKFGRFRSGRRDERHSGFTTPEPLGHDFGNNTVLMSRKIQRRSGYRYVKVRCACQRESWRSLDSLRAGVSPRCPQCRGEKSRKPYPNWLRQRLLAARTRCQNPRDPGYQNYGARGIEFRFKTIEEACMWVKDNLGLRQDLTLDRVDNDGHYQRGNLRWATYRQQAFNNRQTVLDENFVFRQNEWPYSKETTMRKLREGKTRKQIIASARRAVREKRKNHRGIHARLESMTS